MLTEYSKPTHESQCHCGHQYGVQRCHVGPNDLHWLSQNSWCQGLHWGLWRGICSGQYFRGIHLAWGSATQPRLLYMGPRWLSRSVHESGALCRMDSFNDKKQLKVIFIFHPNVLRLHNQFTMAYNPNNQSLSEFPKMSICLKKHSYNFNCKAVTMTLHNLCACFAIP